MGSNREKSNIAIAPKSFLILRVMWGFTMYIFKFILILWNSKQNYLYIGGFIKNGKMTLIHNEYTLFCRDLVLNVLKKELNIVICIWILIDGW